MVRIAAAFERARSQGRAAIALYFTVGYPDVAATVTGVRAALRGGADIIELGVPFSDPLADGATIQRSSTAALREGVTLDTCLETAALIRREDDQTPILFMGYYNPFYQYGIDRLAEKAAEVGVDGLIVPDLPPEEAGALDAGLAPRGLALIYLVAPTSPDDRVRIIGESARGFVYCVSLTGITGERDEVSADVPGLTARVRARTALPLALGFGISRPEHVAAVSPIVDAVVIGSAMVNLMGDTGDEHREAAVESYVRSLTEAGRLAGAGHAPSAGGSA